MHSVAYTKDVFLWLMSAVYLIAFASLYVQIPGKCLQTLKFGLIMWVEITRSHGDVNNNFCSLPADMSTPLIYIALQDNAMVEHCWTRYTMENMTEQNVSFPDTAGGELSGDNLTQRASVYGSKSENS